MTLSTLLSQECLVAMARLAEGAPAGCLVEVGVYRGGSAAFLYEVAQRQGRELHLFDTFRGMPVEEFGLDKHRVGEFADCPLGEMRAAMPGAHFRVGVFPGTLIALPDDIDDIAFVHCDCDQYESYRAVIGHLWPRMVSGGVMLFDDYPYLAGAKKAVEERFQVEDLRPTGAGRFYVVKP
jgi:hypothetical protein